MIALVEGAERQKTPNELALSILLSGLTLIFLIVCVTLWPLAAYSGTTLSVTVLVALLVCLIPTTIGGLLSAIGIAGMDRLIRFNVIATSGRAVEAAGDVDTLLLDKTGTITFGNRMASEFMPVAGVAAERAGRSGSCSPAWPTTRRKAARSSRWPRPIMASSAPDFDLGRSHDRPFTAHTRLSGVDSAGARCARARSIPILRRSAGRRRERRRRVSTGGRSHRASRRHAARGLGQRRLLGVIHLKDIVKPGIRERFAALRAMGIKTVMITGDNPLTAAAIATEAGVDDFLAQATPEDKLALIRKEQQGGRLIAMCGDGTNDAPALAQADVGVAMQTGTQAAREAGNMVDLDSDPTKLIEIVDIGKQLLMTRGSLTTFSIANDVAKYFAIMPALFIATYPELSALNVMRLASQQSAILSAVIFNALIIIALIPLALKGVSYRPVGAAALLRRNLRSTASAASSRLHRHQDHRHPGRRPASGLRRIGHAEPNSSRPRPAGAVHAADGPRLSPGDHRRRPSRHALSGQRQPDLDEGRRRRRLGADRAELRERQVFPCPSLGDQAQDPRPRRSHQDDRRAL